MQSKTKLKESTEVKNRMYPLRIQSSKLYVNDMDSMANFYTNGVGLDIIENKDKGVKLGKNNTVLLELEENKDMPPSPRGSAGLYHNAFLFTDSSSLAQQLKKILTIYPMYFQGSSNHIVSRAFYFSDPEGNGVEMYWDVPEKEWEWINDQIKMGNIYIDPVQFINDNLSDIQNESLVLGHIHLKVGTISEAKYFYVDLLGFAITSQMDSALFISSGGYHHHIGLNTWESLGTGKRNTSRGLESFTINARPHEYKKIKERLSNSKYLFKEANNTLTLQDPWNTHIIITQ